ncbi:MAG: YibE/F family protein, partial [Eubacteriales bacterium]|nr:YibE/F family protein [Eubacteriales bacterium]
MKKNQIIYILTILLAVIYLIVGHQIATLNSTSYLSGVTAEYQKAVVATIEDTTSVQIDVDGESKTVNEEIYITAKVSSGEKKGEILHALQTYDGTFLGSIKKVEVGDKIVLMNNLMEESSAAWIVIEYVRSDALWILAGILAVCILIFGRKKGFNTILSLVFTCGAVFTVFIPAILAGQNIYLWSLITCTVIVLVTLLTVIGANRKSLGIGLGCLGGFSVSAFLIIIMDHIIKLTGMIDEESMYLMYLNENDPLNLKAVIFAAILLGALGAIMDVAMDIGAALYEIADKTETPTFTTLAKSGMNIGRDILGTMANTLVLAYIGSSLSLVLLLMAYNNSLLFLFNRELIVVEILQTLVGSFGIVFAIP